MKKTIVALAVAAVAATSANAATVYNQDGTKVEVNGSVRVLLEKAKDKRTDLKDNGSRIVFKGSQDIGNGLSALANVELRLSAKEDVLDASGKKVKDFKGNTVKKDRFGNKVSTKRLYAGLAYAGVGTLTFGKQATIGDKVGYSDYSYLYGGIGKPLSEGDRVINFASDSFNGFSFGVGYVFDKEVAKEAAREGRGVVLAALYERKFGDFGFKFGTGYAEQETSKVVNKSQKEKTFKVGTELSYTAFAAGVDYLQSKKSGTQEKKRGVELGLQYKVTDMAKVYTVLSHVKENKTNTAYYKTRALTVGAGYKLHKQVETFVEGGWNKTKDQTAKVINRDRNVGVGLRVHF